MSLKHTTLASAVVTALALPLAAHAESTYTGAATGPVSASARLDFRVVIPVFAYLRVGTGSTAPSLAADGTIDRLLFDVPAANVGNSTAVAATGGDTGGGASVTFRMVGNNGNMTLAATGNPVAGPVNAGGQNIAWTQFSSSTSGPVVPTIGGAAVPYAATAGVVNSSGTWTYQYLNTTAPASGQYDGRVTYTATTP
jgi:hypothetical protein